VPEFNNTNYTLLQRAIDLNDEAAWQELHAHYRKFIYFMMQDLGVTPNDIDDVAQKILLGLMKNLKKFDRDKARFRTWLKTVIKNQVYMHYRKIESYNRRISGLQHEHSVEPKEYEDDLELRIEKEWENYITNTAMKRVSRAFAPSAIEAFKLGLAGKTAVEIAQLTDMTESSVYTLRMRVKKAMLIEIRLLTKELEG